MWCALAKGRGRGREAPKRQRGSTASTEVRSSNAKLAFLANARSGVAQATERTKEHEPISSFVWIAALIHSFVRHAVLLCTHVQSSLIPERRSNLLFV